MNAKEAIENIKKLIFGDEPIQAAAPALPVVFGTEYIMADGTIMVIDKLEVGGVCKTNDIVCPDGVHVLEDGTEIEIISGLIASVKPKAEPVEGTDMASAIAQMQIEIDAIKAGFEIQKTEFQKVTVKADTQQKANEELVKLVEFLAQEPATAPAQKPIDFENLTPLERFRFQKQLSN